MTGDHTEPTRRELTQIMMTKADITDMVTESIRVHHATGHFDEEKAIARLKVAGFAERTDEQAAELLAEPVDAAAIARHNPSRDIRHAAQTWHDRHHVTEDEVPQSICWCCCAYCNPDNPYFKAAHSG